MHPANPKTRARLGRPISIFEIAVLSENLELVKLLGESIKPVNVNYIDVDVNSACPWLLTTEFVNVLLVEVFPNAVADANLNTNLLENYQYGSGNPDRYKL